MINILSNYKEDGFVLTYIKLHVVFCTRYRRKFFNNKSLVERAQELINSQCDKMGVEILELSINESYVKMTILCSPNLSPVSVVNNIKKFCNIKQLRDDFPVFKSVPSVWTRGCLITTEELSENDILNYVMKQKKRS